VHASRDDELVDVEASDELGEARSDLGRVADHVRRGHLLDDGRSASVYV